MTAIADATEDDILELESWGRHCRLVELGGKIRFAGKT